ncbi:TolC family protein [Odoribacter lunatus]|uniref:TolC family protein n=1 Tax=Odoribacter lunatus TaxID=2941335 RepID=UPI00203C3CFE|nr:TolC family protein [Odoribacter lunatus]
MIKSNLFILFIALLSLSSNAQSSKWTLQECINYGIEQSLSMERQLLNNEIDKTHLRDAYLDFLPSVSGSSSIGYNFGRSIGENNTYINTRIMANSYSLGASLNLFSGFTAINTLRYRKVSKLKGIKDSEKRANDIAINIMQAFYDLAYVEGLIEISKEQLENAQLQLKKTQRQYELGIKPKSDLFDLQAQVAESEYSLISNQNKKSTALVTLKQIMNYQADEELEINASTLSSILPENESINTEQLFNQAVEQLPEINSAQFAIKTARLNWYIYKGQLLPSFSMSGNLNTSYYDTQNNSFSKQFKDNLGKSFGFSVNIPIFNGLYRHSNITRAKYQMKDAEYAYQETMQNAYKEIELAVLELQAVTQEYNMAIKKLNFSELSYQANKKKYEQGLVTIMDVNTSDNNLRQAKLDLLKAKLTYGIKKKMVSFYQGTPLQTKIKF